MLLRLFTPQPHEDTRRRTRRPPPVATLVSSPRGNFFFNKIAVELLELHERLACVRLGHERQDPTAWVVQACEPGLGYEVVDMGGPRNGLCTRGFRSRLLREQLLRHLPFASAGKPLLLPLDPLSCLTQAGEAWALDTAPYCQPPAPAPAAPEPAITLALRMTLPPELRAQMARCL